MKLSRRYRNYFLLEKIIAWPFTFPNACHELHILFKSNKFLILKCSKVHKRELNFKIYFQSHRVLIVLLFSRQVELRTFFVQPIDSKKIYCCSYRRYISNFRIKIFQARLTRLNV